MSEWRPIETAPRDGSVFDIWIKCKDCEFRGVDFTYRNGELIHEGSDQSVGVHYGNVDPVASHWMPQPKPPKPTPCRARLAEGQWWKFCGETDIGQTEPALCTECGGTYKRA